MRSDRPKSQLGSSSAGSPTHALEHQFCWNFDRWLTEEQSRSKQMLFCIIVCLTTLSFRLLMERWLHGGLPFVFFGPMVTFCALRMGYSGGAIAVTGALVCYLAEPPYVSGRYGSFIVAEGLYVLSSLLIMAVCDRCRTALMEVKRQRLELLARSQVQVDLALKSASLGGLTASMRHEVNQPLAAVKTYAQAGVRWLSRDPPNVEECRAAMLRVVEAADQANGILKRLGDVAKGRPAARIPVCLADIVSEAVAFIQPQAAANDVVLTTAVDECDSSILGDRVMLQQVFSNLLSNGVQACIERREGLRQVRISCSRETAAILILIEDTGYGFADVDPEQSFAAFYTTKEFGMGLGLPISRMTIEAHGGVLTIGNRPQGAGAFALVHLPLP